MRLTGSTRRREEILAFWPRISITSNGVTRPIDPSGSVAGVMARIDGSRGVWKASAGVEAAVFQIGSRGGALVRVQALAEHPLGDGQRAAHLLELAG